MTPPPLDPYVFRARLGRVAEGGAALLHFDRGFGDWKLASKWPGGPDAKYPQGRYRLNGIASKDPLTTEARIRLSELVNSGGELLARTTKLKQKFLVDLFVRHDLPAPPEPSEAERKAWLSDERLGALASAEEEGSVLRDLVAEVLWSRRALGRDSRIVHLNQHLLDEGLAAPHKAGS